MPESIKCTLPFRRLLMLQGPVGPFFRLLAGDLRRQGVTVRKVNLNAGDALYFPGPDRLAYRGGLDDWPDYLRGLLRDLEIDAIALFGDSRAYHRAAIAEARDMDVPAFVFEEGYIRPDYVTVELNGVNGKSGLIPRRGQPGVASAAPPESPAAGPIRAVAVGNTFPAMAMHSIVYWAAMDLGQLFYPHYRHHKPHSLAEIRPWLLSAYRKMRHARRDKAAVAKLLRHDTPYFAVPLQVHRDSQIIRDSGFLSVGHFIVTVMESFAADAPVDHVLVLKQHPMDRGHTDYTALVRHTATRLGCVDRVLYVRDAHLPTLLRQARGTLTINSTVGLSSLFHGTPVKALGRAIYDRPGLTAQCSLREFWTAPEKVDPERVRDFMGQLIETCQANGSFYTNWSSTGLGEQVTRHMARQFVLRTRTAISASPAKATQTAPAATAEIPPRPSRRERSEQPEKTVR